MADINALWIGESLGPLERACLASFVRLDQPVTLHSYRRLDTPPGVALADANAILPEAALFRHRKSGSWCMAADLFRYRLLQRRPGALYVDADIFCLRPFDAESPWLFGAEVVRRRGPGVSRPVLGISNAVLRLPPQSPVLDGLLGLFEKPVCAARFSPLPQQRLRFLALAALGVRFSIGDMNRVVAGPPALTHFLHQQGLEGRALPPEAIFHRQGPGLFAPGSEDALAEPGRHALHFMRSGQSDAALAHPAPGSAYHACCALLERRA